MENGRKINAFRMASHFTNTIYLLIHGVALLVVLLKVLLASLRYFPTDRNFHQNKGWK